MSFVSVSYLIFIALVLILEPLKRFNTSAFIAIISMLFYVNAGLYLVTLLLISSILDHLISAKFNSKHKLLWVILAVSVNLSFLIGVKVYYYIGSESSIHESLIPLGISFYTLQSISYLIDVYKGKIKRLDNFLDYLAYISFFPQLIAGPIERCRSLQPQLRNFGLVSPRQSLPGIKLLVIGLFLKLAVANNLEFPILLISSRTNFDIIFFLNGVLVFIYIYADFFSYTLMARGIAALFGINLSLNFNQPFRKKNLISFWNSWHMSLTKWMIDYFYIPIMLKIQSKRIMKIIFFTLAMALIGLWHGIGVNYVLFGVTHGVMMQLLPTIDKFTSKTNIPFPKINNRFGIFFTIAITGNIFLGGSPEQLHALLVPSNYTFFNPNNLAPFVSVSFLIGILLGTALLIHEFSQSSYFYRRMSVKWDLALIATFLTLTCLFYKEGGNYVYFAF